MGPYSDSFQHDSVAEAEDVVYGGMVTVSDRLTVGGVAIGLFTFAASVLAPERKWLGWVALLGASLVLFIWAYAEGSAKLLSSFAARPLKATLLVAVACGTLGGGVFWLVASSKVRRAAPAEAPVAAAPAAAPGAASGLPAQAPAQVSDDAGGTSEPPRDRSQIPQTTSQRKRLPTTEVFRIRPRTTMGGRLDQEAFTEFSGFQRESGWQALKDAPQFTFDWGQIAGDADVAAEVLLRSVAGRAKAGVMDVGLGAVVAETDWVSAPREAFPPATRFRLAIPRSTGTRSYRLMARPHREDSGFNTVWATGFMGPLAPAYPLVGEDTRWVEPSEDDRWVELPQAHKVELDWGAIGVHSVVAELWIDVQRVEAVTPGRAAVRIRDLNSGAVVAEEAGLDAWAPKYRKGPGDVRTLEITLSVPPGQGISRYVLEGKVPRVLRIRAAGVLVVVG